jgi:hypothetical protein
MSWLMPSPRLDDGEAVIFDSAATTLQPSPQPRGPFKARRQGQQIQVGGRLTVTDRRLIFLPARFNPGGRALELLRSEIAGVRLEVSAGLLAIQPALPAVAVEHPGGEALFAVTRTRELMQALSQTGGRADR